MRFNRLVLIVMLLVGTFVSMNIGFAQEDGETCDQFAPQALSDLGINCANLPDNNACYGYLDIEATLIEGMPKVIFAEPGDQAELTSIARLKTQIFNLNDQLWGLGLMNVHAYVETTANNEVIQANLSMLAIGDVEVEQSKEPELDENGVVIVDSEHMAPMQDFFLRNSFAKPGCEDALRPSILAQGQPDKEIDFWVNGAKIRLDSATTIVRILEPANGSALPPMTGEYMRVYAMEGMVKVNPDTLDELLIPAGYYTDICLTPPEDLGVDGEENDQLPLVSCDRFTLEPMSQAELNELSGLALLPGNILNFDIDLFTITNPSSVANTITVVEIENATTMTLIEEACDNGQLSEEVCASYLLQSTPAEEETCEPFVRRVITEAVESCEGLADNSVCYGFLSAEASSIEGLQPISLVFPGDQDELTSLALLKTNVFNLDEEFWGIGEMNVAAYVGTTDNGEVEQTSVRVVSLGNVELERRVAPEFDENGELIIDSEHLAPMQEFFLRNSFDTPECEEAPNYLTQIQSQDDAQSTLWVNGAAIRLDPAEIVLKIMPRPFDSPLPSTTNVIMRMFVLGGTATLNADTPDEQSISAGKYVDVCLSEPENLGLDGIQNDRAVSCDWTEESVISQADLDDLGILGGLRGELVNRR